MRWRLFQRLFCLATLLLASVTAVSAGTRVRASADAGVGMLEEGQFTGGFAVGLEPADGATLCLVYRHTLTSLSMMSFGSRVAADYEYIGTLVLARESQRPTGRTTKYWSVGVGVGAASAYMKDGVGVLGPRMRLETKLGLGVASAVGIQFPALFGPVGSRIALHHQLVSVNVAHRRAQSAMALTLGLVY